MRVVILQALTWGTVTASIASATWLAYQESADASGRPQRSERRSASVSTQQRLPAAAPRALPTAQRIETDYTGPANRGR